MTKSKKYIDFELVEKKPKTSVYAVVNKESRETLGYVKWYPSWRKYCFFPAIKAVYDVICLDDIKNFIQNLMDERMVIKREERIKLIKESGIKDNVD